MNEHAFPEAERFVRKRRIEQLLRACRPAFGGCLAGSLLFAVTLAVFPIPPSGLLAILIAFAFLWVAAAAFLMRAYFKNPHGIDVAKRADHVLGLSDDLMALSEFPSGAGTDTWKRAAFERAGAAVSKAHANWKPSLKRADRALLALACAAALLAGYFAVGQATRISREMAERDAGRDQRQQAAKEILEDWEEFSQSTDEPELQKLFAQAANIREAINQDDPMQAMLEINRVQAGIQSLIETISASSLAPHAGKIAEAMESFEGAGAMAAAMRNANFESAAREAEKLAGNLQTNSTSAIRRADATSEMLANESAAAARRGNSALSETLSQLSRLAKSHAPSAAIPNKDLQPCAGKMADHLKQEAARQACQRAASIGKSQLDALRAGLRGESPEPTASLCKNPGNQTGGQQAGSGTDGNPASDPTDLASPSSALLAQSAAGEGESQITESRTASGSAGKASADRQSGTPDYFELSMKAVADESLPLAHRRTIRTYFERIRPIAESP